jgi:hypothetical protein
MTRDDDILIRQCACPGEAVRPARLSVDDFADSEEAEITAAEIHVTILAWDGRREEPGPCFALSVVSARQLALALDLAIRRRESAGGGS